LLCDLADDVGLTDELSVAIAPAKQRRRGHDRREVLVDRAVAVADGATSISDLRALGDQPASPPWASSWPSSVWAILMRHGVEPSQRRSGPIWAEFLAAPPHRSLSQRAPCALDTAPALIGDIDLGRLRRTGHLGGLIHGYRMVA
jgi:hypothetical protein